MVKDGGQLVLSKKSKELTVVELAAKLVVRAALHHFGHMFGFLVDGHGPDDGALWRGGQHLDLDGTCLGNLAIELLQVCRILKKSK